MSQTHLFNFSSGSKTRFQLNGEEGFCQERPCIIERYSIALVAGTGLYTLPEYVSSIRRVTYLGWKVYPLPHRDLRASYLSGVQQSRPYWYIFNNVGQLQIQLFPVPAIAVAQISAANNTLWGTDIVNCFCIEFYRSPDGSTYKIPPFFRQRFLDAYVNKRCFSIDGPGMSMKAAKFWNDKFETMQGLYTELLDDINNSPRNLVANNQSSRPYGFTPPPPILPVDRYGISVDEPGW